MRWLIFALPFCLERFEEDIRVTAREFIKLFYQVDVAVTDAQLDRILAGAQPGGRGR